MTELKGWGILTPFGMPVYPDLKDSGSKFNGDKIGMAPKDRVKIW